MRKPHFQQAVCTWCIITREVYCIFVQGLRHPVCFRVLYRVACLEYEQFVLLFLIFRTSSLLALQSSAQELELLTVPWGKLPSTWAVAAPTVWNQLTSKLRRVMSSESFKSLFHPTFETWPGCFDATLLWHPRLHTLVFRLCLANMIVGIVMYIIVSSCVHHQVVLQFQHFLVHPNFSKGVGITTSAASEVDMVECDEGGELDNENSLTACSLSFRL